MIFGKNNGSWSLALPALLLMWLFLPVPAPMSVAQTPSQSEREAGSTSWNVEQLIQNLAKNRQSEVRFEETAFSHLLTQPLKTQGILRFTPPTGLEKHITAPHDERYLVEGDTVLFESKTKGTKRTLSLHDYPVLRAFIEAFRSTLADDVVTLKRFYSVALQGEPRRWVLILRPLDKAVQELVESIRFSGEREQVGSIEILAPDGDRSVMVITTGAP
ncbi:MAG: outer membrane lipoprotein carrier protein LolA [Nitrospiraceae bacterium]|nr:MAG: outer membrane lipoprotein carrier protein LolA [Nitrospiraceae bacterium]